MSRRYNTNKLLYMLERDDSIKCIENSFRNNMSAKLLRKIVFYIGMDPDDQKVLAKLRSLISILKTDYTYILNNKPEKLVDLLSHIKIRDITLPLWIELFTIFKPVRVVSISRDLLSFFSNNINNYLVYKNLTDNNDFDLEISENRITNSNQQYVYSVLKKIAIMNRTNEKFRSYVSNMQHKEIAGNLKSILGESSDIDLAFDPEIFRDIDPYQNVNISVYSYTRLYLCYVICHDNVCPVCKHDLSHLCRYFKYNKIVVQKNVEEFYKTAISTSYTDSICYYVRHSPAYATSVTLNVLLREVFTSSTCNTEIYETLGCFPLHGNESNEECIVNLFELVKKHRDNKQYLKALNVSRYIKHTRNTIHGLFNMVYFFLTNNPSPYVQMLTKNAVFHNLKMFERHFAEIIHFLVNDGRDDLLERQIVMGSPHQDNLTVSTYTPNHKYQKRESERIDGFRVEQTAIERIVLVMCDLFCDDSSEFLNRYLHEIAFHLDEARIREIFSVGPPKDYGLYRKASLILRKIHPCNDKTEIALPYDRDPSFVIFIVAYSFVFSYNITELFQKELKMDKSKFLTTNITQILFSVRRIFLQVQKTRYICIFDTLNCICGVFSDNPVEICNHLHPFAEYFLNLEVFSPFCTKCDMPRIDCKRAFLKKYTGFVGNMRFSNLIEHVKRLKFFDDYFFIRGLTQTGAPSVNSNTAEGSQNSTAGSRSLLTDSCEIVECIIRDPKIIFYGKDKNHLSFTIMHRMLSQITNENIHQGLLFLEELTTLFYKKQRKIVNEYTLLWYRVFLGVFFCFANAQIGKIPTNADKSRSLPIDATLRSEDEPKAALAPCNDQIKSSSVSSVGPRPVKKIKCTQFDKICDTLCESDRKVLGNLDMRSMLLKGRDLHAEADYGQPLCESDIKVLRNLNMRSMLLKGRDLHAEADYGLQNLLCSPKYREKMQNILNTAMGFLANNMDIQLACHLIGFIGMRAQSAISLPCAIMDTYCDSIGICFQQMIIKILTLLIDHIDMEDQDRYFYAIQETSTLIEQLSSLSSDMYNYIKPFLETTYTFELTVPDKKSFVFHEDMAFSEFLREVHVYLLNILRKHTDQSYFKCLRIGLLFNEKIMRVYVEAAVKIIFSLNLPVFQPIMSVLEDQNLENIDQKIISFILGVNQECRFTLLETKIAIPAAFQLRNFHYVFRYCSQKPFIEKNGYDLLQFVYFILDDRDNCLAINNARSSISKMAILYELLLEKDYTTAKHLIKRYDRDRFDESTIPRYSRNESFEDSGFESKSLIGSCASRLLQISNTHCSNVPHRRRVSVKNDTLYKLFSQRPYVQDDEIAQLSSSASQTTFDNSKHPTPDDENFLSAIQMNEKDPYGADRSKKSSIASNGLRSALIDTDEYRLSYILEKYNKTLENLDVTEIMRQTLEKADSMHVWKDLPDVSKTPELLHAVYDIQLLKNLKNSSESFPLVASRRLSAIITSNRIYEAHQLLFDFYKKNLLANQAPPLDYKNPDNYKHMLGYFHERLNFEICEFCLSAGQIEEFKTRIVDMQIHEQLSGYYLLAKHKYSQNHFSEAQNLIKKILYLLPKNHFIHEDSWLFYAEISKSTDIFVESATRLKDSEKLFYSWGKYLEPIDPLSALDQYINSFHCGNKLRRLSFPKILHLLCEELDNANQNQVLQKSRIDYFKKASQKFMTFVQKINPHDLVEFFSLVLSKISHQNSNVCECVSVFVATMIDKIPHKTIWSSLIMIHSTNKEVRDRMKKIKASLNMHAVLTLNEYLEFSDTLVRIGNYSSKNIRSFSLKEKMGIHGRVSGSISVPNFHMSAQIQEFRDDVKVFVSLQSPKKITFLASDGISYSFLCKSNDDLRKDSKFMDLSRLLNDIFDADPECKKRDCYIQSYRIIPITPKSGIIEWVDGLMTLRSVIDKLYHNIGKNIAEEQNKFKRKKKIGISDFQNVLERFPPVLHEYFDRFLDPVAYYTAIQKFTRTCAVMSIVGWFMGLGDRHLDNLLINERDGSLFHVDLNCIFEKATKLEIPERVPFRLTQNIVAAFGPLGVTGTFTRTMEACYQAMSKNRELIIANMLSIVYDPMHDIRIGKKSAEESSKILLESLEKKLEREDHFLVCEELIQNAMDFANLSEMFIGWCPFI